MFVTDIKRVIDQVSKDKGLDPQVLIETLEDALKSAARKKYGVKADIETKYNPELGEIEVFLFKEVIEDIEDIEDADIQFSLEKGREFDPECEIGDSIGVKLDNASFGRIAAQSAKQVIIQKIKDAERSAVYDKFAGRKGEIVNGIVQRIIRKDIIVNLGQAEAILPVREQAFKESFQRNDRIRANILKVMQDTRGPQVVLTRSHPDFVVNLFKVEVPEIRQGVVNIMGIAREPGIRSKVAVNSTDVDIDPVGACVGMKGSRVQLVVQELKGEKIDIVPWHIDPAKFVCNALSPAEISRVIIDEENSSMEVIVPDEFLSVAIGKQGQNVRLAAKLTGWDLDVVSEVKYSKKMRKGYDSLLQVPGVTIGLADALYEVGFFEMKELGASNVEDLMQVHGIDSEEKAEGIIIAAKELTLKNNKQDNTNSAPLVENEEVSKSDEENTLDDKDNIESDEDDTSTTDSNTDEE